MINDQFSVIYVTAVHTQSATTECGLPPLCLSLFAPLPRTCHCESAITEQQLCSPQCCCCAALSVVVVQPSVLLLCSQPSVLLLCVLQARIRREKELMKILAERKQQREISEEVQPLTAFFVLCSWLL